MAYPNLQRFGRGTAEYNRAKENYDRNIKLYVELARKAGISVNANTSPQDALRQNRADASGTAGVPATGSVRPPSEQQAASSGGTVGTSGNLRPRPGSQAARDWDQAIQFWNWSQMSVPNLQRFAPGTAQHERAKTNYERNIKLYLEYAARAGIRVTAQTPPNAVFGS